VSKLPFHELRNEQYVETGLLWKPRLSIANVAVNSLYNASLAADVPLIQLWEYFTQVGVCGK
jgi:hypothetical protein